MSIQKFVLMKVQKTVLQKSLLTLMNYKRHNFRSLIFTEAGGGGVQGRINMAVKKEFVVISVLAVLKASFK